ncbi:RNA 2',3'-cyclic phosphodiesterase [Nitrospirota bacterium]
MGLRTFIAIEVPENVRSAIIEALGPLRKLLPDPVKWVGPDNIHLTLKFLGDTPEEKIRGIEAAMARAAGALEPMEVAVSGAGAFPNLRRPSVIWAGLNCPPALLELKKRIESELASLGFEEDSRVFSPHLTVGRVRRGAKIPRRRLAAEIERLEKITFGAMDIREIVLMKSDLRPGSPVYTKLYSAALSD